MRNSFLGIGDYLGRLENFRDISPKGAFSHNSLKFVKFGWKMNHGMGRKYG